jgi:hypothetical protein
MAKKTSDKKTKSIKNIDVKINAFGEIISNYNVDKLNAFLNEEIQDKKLTEKDVPKKEL